MNSKDITKIILKDIQDTYSMIRQCENLSTISKIEHDLLLEKVRKLYDHLLKITPETIVEGFQNEIEQKDKELSEKSFEEIEEKKNTIEWKVKPSEEMHAVSKAEKEEVKEEKLTDDTNAKENEGQPEENDMPETEQILQEDETTSENEQPSAEILAEKFQSKKSVNEALNSKVEKKKDVSSVIKKKPLKDIGAGIGINDRFLFVRELFDGDKEHYNETIQVLNNFNSFDNAYAFLKEEFNWDMEDENVVRLIELVERRFKN